MPEAVFEEALRDSKRNATRRQACKTNKKVPTEVHPHLIGLHIYIPYLLFIIIVPSLCFGY